jgi:hypothetical protein
MLRTISYVSILFLASCASTKNKEFRKISSISRDLNGTYLGVAQYPAGRRGPNKPAIRIYLQEVEGETEKYHAVLLEYVDLLKMAPKYIASNKLPIIANRTGYLKNITSNISTYEVVPGTKEGTYHMWPLRVVEDRIEAPREGAPRVLTLAGDENLNHPLEGATISSVREGEPREIFFPKMDDNKTNGIQYGTAKLAYGKAKLESTWRKNFLSGTYLSQYYKVNDVVLSLAESEGRQLAEFKLNEKMAGLSVEKRRSMFTSPLSAFLKGGFTVSEPRDGMFLFQSGTADEKTKEIVHGRIGLFIDIFDASKSLNQDVVELALINPANPEDFLMYYEHPENGEGTR